MSGENPPDFIGVAVLSVLSGSARNNTAERETEGGRGRGDSTFKCEFLLWRGGGSPSRWSLRPAWRRTPTAGGPTTWGPWVRATQSGNQKDVRTKDLSNLESLLHWPPLFSQHLSHLHVSVFSQLDATCALLWQIIASYVRFGNCE